MSKEVGESRAGVALTHLDEPLFAEAGMTKRDLITYLDAVSDRMVPELPHRPLSVIRVHRGQEAFMQKNVPGTPRSGYPRSASGPKPRSARWRTRSATIAERFSGSETSGPSSTTRRLCERTGRIASPISSSTSIRPKGATSQPWAAATRAIAARTERLDPAIATTAFIKDDREGKVFVDSTRVGSATVIACFSPRLRPGVPVSFPVGWDDLGVVSPADFTMHTALERLGDTNPWTAQMVAPQRLSAELIAEGHEIPVARVQAMHEGKRRARARRT